MLDLEKNTDLIRAAIVCDDIRQEKNNKYILIGVFSGNIALSEIPSAFAPQLYLECAPPQSKTSFYLSYFVDEKKVAELRGEFSIQKAGGIVPMVIPPVLIEVDKPGKFSVGLTIENEKPVLVTSKDVVLMSPEN